MITSRRAFITGLGATLITAPAIVRAGSLMPVKPVRLVVPEIWVTFSPDMYDLFKARTDAAIAVMRKNLAESMYADHGPNPFGGLLSA